MTIRISRRRFLATTAATGAGIAMPYLSRAADRPQITHGVQSGDVTADGGVVWSRADRPSRMMVEASTTESFNTIQKNLFIDVLPESDFTAKALLDELPAGQDIFYRVKFADLAEPTIIGEPMVGRFRTAPADKRSVSFTWSGDTVGQGFGINEAWGGMKCYATMHKSRPDFFIHSGDNIAYADGPIPAGNQARQRRALEEHRHRREVKTRRNAGGISRRLQVQPDGQERPRP